MEKIVLALSGGVDSAVAVYLLQKQGYEVYGYTFLTGDDEEKRRQIKEDAAAVATHFGIDHYIEDIAAEFDATVISYFVSQYTRGKTPNPCVFCNRTMKFPKLLAYADSLGIEKVATGHYVGMENGKIVKAKDKKKDQSYVLALLPPSLYPRLVFPLGDYEKPKIREIAAELGLSVAEKGDSQENCFIPHDDYKAFLKQRTGGFCAGDFLDQNGNVLGRHQGLPFYTVGQRRGLGISFGAPKYVIGLNATNNAVILGDEKQLYAADCELKGVNPPFTSEDSFDCTVKIRYLSEAVPATVTPLTADSCKVVFKTPQKSVTPGQFCVFYTDDALLGGGEIIQAAAKD